MKKSTRTYYQSAAIIPGNGNATGTTQVILQSAADEVSGLAFTKVSGSADVLVTIEDNSASKLFDQTDYKLLSPENSHWTPHNGNGMVPVSNMAANSNTAVITIKKVDGTNFGAADAYVVTFRSEKYSHE